MTDEEYYELTLIRNDLDLLNKTIKQHTNLTLSLDKPLNRVEELMKKHLQECEDNYNKKYHPQLSEETREYLRKMLNDGLKYLVRVKDGSLNAFDYKTIKDKKGEWVGAIYRCMLGVYFNTCKEYKVMLIDDCDDLSFIKWEDEEPYKIEDLLKGELR